MFGFFRKKSQVEELILADGLEHVVNRFSEIIARKIPNKEIAYNFILEELDGARMGNAASQAYAKESGISESEYKGALNRSIPEVDGPNGPQQLLMTISSQISTQELMADFRCRIGDKIMQKFKLGKYGNVEDHIQNLLQKLFEILTNDKDVMPALTDKIPAPAGAPVRQINNRMRNIATAKELIENIRRMTGNSTEVVIEHALSGNKKASAPHISKNYTIHPNGFTINDAESGDGLAAIIKDGMFHGTVSISDIGAQGPLAPWELNENPFEDDNHFFGSGNSPQGKWSFSIRPSIPFSKILQESIEYYSKNNTKT